MPSSSKVLLFSAAFGLTSALPWTGPKPTLTYVQANWTPRPTQGSIAKRELFARSLFFSANTCGWTGGDFSSVVTCSSLSSCVWDTARSFIGCCPSNAPCSTGVYTGCVDAQSGSQTVIDPAVTTCSGASVCYLNSFPQQYYQYGCGSANMAATVETTFFNEPSTFHLQIVTTSLDIPAASTITVNSPASIMTGSPTSGSGTSTAVADHPKKASTATIAAGVVGGVAGIVLLVWLAFYLLRKRKDYYSRRPGRNKSRSEKSSSSNSVPKKQQASQASFHRVSNGALSPNPPMSPEMRLIKPPTFPPPPESHKNYPAPRYFTENESPARSPGVHILPRFSPKRISPFTYVPHVPRTKTPRPLSPIILPSAFEPLRYSPKIISPIPFTPKEERQREGDLIPLSPGFHAMEMSPFAFLPSDSENSTFVTEPRQLSPVAFVGRSGAQSPTDTRNVGRELTPSPSQQSLLQNNGSARDMITPSPSGSQQPLLQSSQNANLAREIRTPSPTFHIPLEPVELPASIPSKSRSPDKIKQKKTPSAATYSIIPPIQESPPRQAKRKPATKAVENATPSVARVSSQYSHIALQLSGSPSQSLALKPKTSLQSLAPRSSRTELNLNFTPSAASGSGAALLASRTVSAEEIAMRFRVKGSPKNMSASEVERATAQKGGWKGSTDKIDRFFGFVPGVRSKGTKEKAVQAKRPNRHASSEYVDIPVPPSPTSMYGGEKRETLQDINENEGEYEKERKETSSICSANILDVGSEGMGTLPFTMEFEWPNDDYVGQDDDGGRKEKGVKWRDEVASDGIIAESSETPPRLDTPNGGAGGDEWSRGFGDWNWINRENKGDNILPSHGQAWPGSSSGGNWL